MGPFLLSTNFHTKPKGRTFDRPFRTRFSAKFKHMNISFIGLGIMGRVMATHLLQPQISLTVYNRSIAAAQWLGEQGAQVATDPQTAVVEAEIVFSMLSTPAVVKSLFFGRDGLLAAMPKNALWVDCSTVDPAFSREAAQEAAAHGIRFMDAPVAGSKPQAEARELAFLVGGSVENLTLVRPYLELMGKKVLHLGAEGQGTSFKLLVNLMLAQQMAAFSETVQLGQQLGLNRDFLLDALPQLPVAAPFVQAKAARIKAGEYSEQFPLEWMLKDIDLAIKSAPQPLPMAQTTRDLYAAAQKEGMSRLDFSAIFKYLEEK